MISPLRRPTRLSPRALRWLVALAVSAAAALPAIAAAPASARDADGHITGTLNMTLDDTSGDCNSSDEVYGVHFTGAGQIDDTWQRNPNGTYDNPDSSVLNLSGNWNNTFCPSSSYGGSVTGTVNGFDLDNATGTVVDWSYDVEHPGLLALSMTFHGDGNANDPGGTCGGSAPTSATIFTGINFPQPAGGDGVVHIDKTLTYGAAVSGEDVYADHWVGGADGCGGSSTDGTVAHVTGDLTISQPPSAGGGSPGPGAGSGSGGGAGAHAAGSASGGSGSVGKNGSATVGSVSCAGPGSCSASTTVSGTRAAKSAKKKAKPVTYGHARTTIAAGKKRAIAVKLSKKALKTLSKSGKLKTKVTIVITSAGDQKVTKHFALTLKRAKAKKH